MTLWNGLKSDRSKLIFISQLTNFSFKRKLLAPLHVNYTLIEWIYSIRYLIVRFDGHLTWSPHIEEIADKETRVWRIVDCYFGKFQVGSQTNYRNRLRCGIARKTSEIRHIPTLFEILIPRLSRTFFPSSVACYPRQTYQRFKQI